MKVRLTRLVLAAGLLPALLVLGLSLGASASVPTSVAVYGASARSAGVHAIGGTSQFPNFASGAVDNRYPLASVGQDSSPSTHGAASPADYGPLAATVLTDPPTALCTPPFPTTLCDNHKPPPDVYALAQYPTPPGKPEDHYSTGGSDHADAFARELGADANGTYSGGTPGSVVSQATADAHTVVDASGALHIHSHSHVSSASVGPLVMKDVDVAVEVVSSGGIAKSTAHVTPGVVNDGKADHPVAADGTKQSFTVPSVPPVIVTVFAVKPDDQTKGDTGKISATGSHVVVDQPAGDTATGQHQFSHRVEYIFGESSAEGFLKPSSGGSGTDSSSSEPSSVADSGGSSTLGSTDTVTTPGSAPESFTGAPGSEIAGTSRNPGAKSATSGGRKRVFNLVGGRIPFPLASLFFIWEALVLGAAASTVWVRRASKVRP